MNSRALPDGIEEEHRRLLADLADEAGVRLDDELDAGRAQAVGEPVPIGGVEQDAEVGHGHGVAVDLVAEQGAPVGIGERGVEVGDELVAVEVEVDPRRRRPTLRATEHFAVERPSGGEVVDRHRQMEARSSCSTGRVSHSGRA